MNCNTEPMAIMRHKPAGEPTLVMSRCHLYEGEWEPEHNSPQGWMRRHTRMKNAVRTGPRIHWLGSKLCQSMQRVKSDAVAARCFDGYEFNQTPEHKRCTVCDFDFTHA